MAFCPSCGNELSEEQSNAKFCAHCGQPLAAEAPVVEETTTTEEAPATEEAPKAAEPKLNIDMEDIKANAEELKDQTLDACDKVIDKAKTVPALANILDKIDKKFYPAVVAAPIVLVLLILVIAVSAIFGGGGYMSPMNDYMKLINKKSTDSMKYAQALSPKNMEKLLKTMIETSEAYEKQMDNMAEDMEDLFDDLDDEFDKWSISFEQRKNEKVDKDDLEEMQEAIEDRYDDYIEDMVDQMEDTLDDEDKLELYAKAQDISEDDAEKQIKAMLNYYKSFEKAKISEVREIKGKFIFKGDKDEWKSDTVTITMVKMNGEWIYSGEGITFDTDDEEKYLFEDLFDKLEGNYIFAGIGM